ncbi:hypothetical protein QFC22_000363 [Naganishia vaughanmartiniae]|uniref:Uncharacterized protein n=1 Tax=Naganishia vaughanmartiniae TaxID=1424756 RepID=A0ACC2XP44_9TREE|nr:hypothetical protein QFC22_000363 [Naganishia vaughanmartiniae]
MSDQHSRMSLGMPQKRAAPSGGFPASPVPSKLRNTPRTGRRAQNNIDVRSGGSRLFSMTESVGTNRRASVATDHTARGQQAAAAAAAGRNGLARGAVLGKDKVHSVLATGDVPVEVWNALQSFADAEEDITTTSAFVDPLIGWTALTTSSSTYVWNHAKRTTSASPTCYTFPHDKPSRRSSSGGVPLTALVSHANTSTTGNEPGLLLVYPTSGIVVFWDRVGMGLMGGAAKGKGKGRAEISVELGKGEVVNGLEKLERDTYLMSTSYTRVVRLSLSQTSGNPSILVKPFEISTRKVFIATSSTPFLFPSASASGSSSGKGIIGIAVGEAISPSKGLVKGMTGDAVRDVWLLTGEECQRWSVGVELQKDLAPNKAYPQTDRLTPTILALCAATFPFSTPTNFAKLVHA